MSRKLATQVKDSRIPGKWKRVAEAYAAVANNDGTNVYRSKENLGKLAGSSPDTIYRNTPDLLACGLLSVAKSHVCKVPDCNKGATHFTGKPGHYTTAYNFHIENLQNAETYLSAKYERVRAAKCRKVGDANCGTTLTIKETPAPSSLTETDSSALTSGIKKETKEPLLASLVADGVHVKDEILSGLEAEPAEKEPEAPLVFHPSVYELQTLWRERTGLMFSGEELILADRLIRTYRYGVVYAVLRNTLYDRQASAKLRWNKFTVFARNWERNHEEYLAWCASGSFDKRRGHNSTVVTKYDPVPDEGWLLKNADEYKRISDYFEGHNKEGDWTFKVSELGVTPGCQYVMMKYVTRERLRVTKNEAINLLFEAAGQIPIGTTTPSLALKREQPKQPKQESGIPGCTCKPLVGYFKDELVHVDGCPLEWKPKVTPAESEDDDLAPVGKGFNAGEAD